LALGQGGQGRLLREQAPATGCEVLGQEPGSAHEAAETLRAWIARRR
jgi:hypothetical protein